MAIWRRGLWSASTARPANDLLADAVDASGRCACCRKWWWRGTSKQSIGCQRLRCRCGPTPGMAGEEGGSDDRRRRRARRVASGLEARQGQDDCTPVARCAARLHGPRSGARRGSQGPSYFPAQKPVAHSGEDGAGGPR